MDGSFREAANGKSKSGGGLNIPQFKLELIKLYPEKKYDINRMCRSELEELALTYFDESLILNLQV